jgi:sulfide:quinone oxidoreductase
VVHLKDGRELAYDLFLGVPIHRVPAVVQESGLAVDGWIPVDPRNLATQHPNVYAIGDVAGAPVAKAGVFAESAARAVAEHLIAEFRGDPSAAPYTGTGTCYVEFGGGQVGRVEADFLTGPSVTAPFFGPSLEGAEQKREFGATRKKRWPPSCLTRANYWLGGVANPGSRANLIESRTLKRTHMASATCN